MTNKDILGSALVRASTLLVPLGGLIFALAFLEPGQWTDLVGNLRAVAIGFAIGSLLSYAAGFFGSIVPLPRRAGRYAHILVMTPVAVALVIAGATAVSPLDPNNFTVALRWTLALVGAVLLPIVVAVTHRRSVRRMKWYVVDYSIWCLIAAAGAAIIFWWLEGYRAGNDFLNFIPPLAGVVTVAGIGWLITTHAKRRDTAIEMTRRLASPEMHASRSATNDFLDNVVRLKFLSDEEWANVDRKKMNEDGLHLPASVESLQGTLQKALDLEAKRRSRDRIREARIAGIPPARKSEQISVETHVSSVIAFYELLYSLAREGAIEESIVRNSFGQRTAWTFVYLYEVFKNDQGSYRYALEKLQYLELLCKPRQIEGFRSDWRRQRLEAIAARDAERNDRLPSQAEPKGLSKSTLVSVPVAEG